MKDENFLKFLKDSSWDLSREEVERLMDEELEKEPDKIDAEFVDACLDYLTEGENLPEMSDGLFQKIMEECSAPANIEVVKKTKRKSFKLKPILVAAAAAALLAVGSVTAYAAYSPSFKDAVVSFFSDHASINYSGKNFGEKSAPVPKEDKKLYKELKDGGINDIVLPDELYDMKYKKLNWQNDDVKKYVEIKYPEKKIVLTILSFKDEKFVPNLDIQGKFTDSQKTVVNGVDVYLFERSGDNSEKVNTTISYQIGLTQYDINGNFNIDQAKNFIKCMN